MAEKIGERMILSHEPTPGYRKALWTAIALGAAYLALVFLFGG